MNKRVYYTYVMNFLTFLRILLQPACKGKIATLLLSIRMLSCKDSLLLGRSLEDNVPLDFLTIVILESEIITSSNKGIKFHVILWSST